MSERKMFEEEHVFIKSCLQSGKRVDFGRIDEKGSNIR